ncbi:putative coleoptile phototropism protein 1-like [Iris pallida]|uniref:Coleoptile phototropism protein 1-like n=1 Tax=Iris pallida TaxID=29817 RepID=A0AAX6FTI6_IRIPA|nr:putative coleoptile phototropism protein 1-like [Iris pallida]
MSSSKSPSSHYYSQNPMPMAAAAGSFVGGETGPWLEEEEDEQEEEEADGTTSSAAADVEQMTRTLTTIRAKNIRPDLLSSIVTHYASKWLPAVLSSPAGSTSAWLKKRSFVEALVSLLPPAADDDDAHLLPCDFLLRLLRAACMVGAGADHLDDVEARVARQLDRATLRELAIPAFSHTCGTLLDFPLVARLVGKFLLLDEAARSGAAVVKVARLVDCYLAEAAADAGLAVADFEDLARALPGHARATDDGLYRAVDTYIKRRPSADVAATHWHLSLSPGSIRTMRLMAGRHIGRRSRPRLQTTNNVAAPFRYSSSLHIKARKEGPLQTDRPAKADPGGVPPRRPQRPPPHPVRHPGHVLRAVQAQPHHHRLRHRRRLLFQRPPQPVRAPGCRRQQQVPVQPGRRPAAGAAAAAGRGQAAGGRRAAPGAMPRPAGAGRRPRPRPQEEEGLLQLEQLLVLERRLGRRRQVCRRLRSRAGGYGWWRRKESRAVPWGEGDPSKMAQLHVLIKTGWIHLSFVFLRFNSCMLQTFLVHISRN